MARSVAFQLGCRTLGRGWQPFEPVLLVTSIYRDKSLMGLKLSSGLFQLCEAVVNSAHGDGRL